MSNADSYIDLLNDPLRCFGPDAPEASVVVELIKQHAKSSSLTEDEEIIAAKSLKDAIFSKGGVIVAALRGKMDENDYVRKQFVKAINKHISTLSGTAQKARQTDLERQQELSAALTEISNLAYLTGKETPDQIRGKLKRLEQLSELNFDEQTVKADRLQRTSQNKLMDALDEALTREKTGAVAAEPEPDPRQELVQELRNIVGLKKQDAEFLLLKISEGEVTRLQVTG
ncbi:hypothetical protein ACQU0X_28890 [Pseudovibrio ascidiaceicola]|uniref:hypothetical protein n=1 Tax=Pseudovibrio ascidiaceicola TaxID=285279 RepID=UPI003D36130E